MRTAAGSMRTKMGLILGATMTAFVACGGKGGNSSGDGGPSLQPPNHCATMNGTYSATQSQQPGGTCLSYVPSPFCQKGASEVSPCEMKVNADGTIDLPTNMTCASFMVTGCTTRGSDCRYTSDGQSFTENFEITFAEEGIAATGTLSITGTGNGVTGTGNGQACSATYGVTATRQ